MADPRPPFSKVAEDLIASFRRLPRDEPERQRKRPTREAGEAIEELLAKYHIGRTSLEDTIRAHWGEIVGPANAEYSHALRIDGKRLAVQASHAVVRNELFLHRATIVERIQQLPGCSGVKEIWVRAG
jgi:Dna[CI] antecedent, DciA